MAEENGSKKKLIIIVAAVVTLLIIAVGVYFIFLSGDGQDADAAPVKTDQHFNAANYVPIPEPMIFNVMEGKRERTVQINVQLMVNNADNEALARKHIPLLESALLRVFGAASAEQLRSPEGKSELRKTALVELNEATIKLEGRALIHSVLFTGFVLQ
jgi:flagellar FliL protein